GPSYRVRVQAPAGASAAAAVVGAASEALAALFPSQVAFVGAALAEAMGGLPRSRGTARGLALGRAVADQELALRLADGSAATVPYTPGTQPSQWRPTPPSFALTLDPQWPAVTPFVL